MVVQACAAPVRCGPRPFGLRRLNFRAGCSSNLFFEESDDPSGSNLMSCVHRWRVLVICTLFLTACGSYLPPADLSNMSRDQIVERLGQPEMQRTMADGGSRLEFPTGPRGKQTWFVYLNAAGEALRAEQVLTEQNFNRVTPGMTQDAVREMLGRPGEIRTLARSRGVVWSYRYENPFCQWFQVEIATDLRVRSAGYGEPPECDRPNEIIIPN